MKRSLVLILCFIVNLCFSQKDSHADSLKRIVKSAYDDSVKAWVFLELSDHYNEPRDWLPWNYKALHLANKNIPVSQGNRKKYFYYVKANALGNLGYYFDYIGNKEKTIKYYFDALKLYDKTDSIAGKAALLSNLGVLFTNQGDYSEGKEFLMQALALKKIADPNDLSKNYNNLGVLYFSQGDINKALYYYRLSERAANQANDPYDLATASNNIGNLYYNQKDQKKSIPYFKKAIEQSLSVDDSISAAYYMCNLGKSYLEINKLDSAKIFFDKADLLSNSSEYMDLDLAVEQNLYNYYLNKGDYKNALDHYRRSIELEEDMNDLSEQKESLKRKLQYDNEVALTKKELQAEEEKKRFNQQILFITILAFLMVILSILIYTRYRSAKKQKLEIEAQKKIVDEQNKEIKDSINYAKYLQKTILPSENDFVRNLVDGFVLFKPKDIVSGDFFWRQDTKKHTFIAVADCTGHGVPGALVSMVCMNALNTVYAGNDQLAPGEFLDQVREIVVQQFTGVDFTAKDGMDISLVRIDQKHKEILFAGANHNCYTVNGKVMEIIKGDRQHVGVAENNEPFSSHSIPWEEGQWIYLMSDGIADQFGGTDGKKLKSKTLLSFIAEQSTDTGTEQKKQILDYFIHWMGKHPQTDDVCVIGLKIA